MSTATVAELAENQSFWVHTSPWFHRPRQARLEIPNKRHNGVHWNYGLSVREPKLIATGTSLAMWRFLRTSARIYWRGQYLLGSTDLVSSINLPLLWNRNDSTSRVGAQPYSLGVYPSPFPSTGDGLPTGCESHQSRAPPAEQEQLKLQGGVLPVGRRCLMG